MASRLRDRTALGPGYAAVTREQERMAAEIDAFEAFRSRVSQTQRGSPPRDRHRNLQSGPTHVLGSPSTDEFATVREAYRETVLAVNHWAEAYDEKTVEDSLPNEFSTELAHVLVEPNGNAFSPWIGERLEREIGESIQRRRETYDVLDEETTALETLTAELDAILEGVRPVVDRDGSFEQRRGRLDTALTTLDELVHTHQTYLHQRDEQANHLLRGMVYADLDTEYPGLSALVAVRRTLDRLNLHFWAALV